MSGQHIYRNLKIGERLDIFDDGRIMTTQKGDLITDNGTRSTLLTVGNDNRQTLFVNPSSGVGLEYRRPTLSDLSDIDVSGSNINFFGYTLANISSPVNNFDAVTKKYVDDKVFSIDPKESVFVATNGSNVSLNNITPASFVIDGVSVTLGKRILLKDQTNAWENGIYDVVNDTVNSGRFELFRSADFSFTTATSHAYTFVETGTVNANSGWILTTLDPLEIDFPSHIPLTFVQFNGLQQITAGNGLNKTGNTLFVKDSNTIFADGTGTKVKSSNTANQILLSDGASSEASWGALPLDNSNSVSGVLPVVNGGTGLTTPLASNSLLVTDAVGSSFQLVPYDSIKTLDTAANAAYVTIDTFTIGDGEVISVDTTLVAKIGSPVVDSASFYLKGTFSRVSSTVNEIGGEQSYTLSSGLAWPNDTTGSSWNAKLTVSGTTVVLQVRGTTGSISSDLIKWKSRSKILLV